MPYFLNDLICKPGEPSKQPILNGREFWTGIASYNTASSNPRSRVIGLFRMGTALVLRKETNMFSLFPGLEYYMGPSN